MFDFNIARMRHFISIFGACAGTTIALAFTLLPIA
jgi:hypothetical protein